MGKIQYCANSHYIQSYFRGQLIITYGQTVQQILRLQISTFAVNQPFDYTNLVWNFGCYLSCASVWGQGIPPIHTFNLAHLTSQRQQQLQLLTSLAMTQSWKIIDPLPPKRRADALSVTSQIRVNQNRDGKLPKFWADSYE